MPRRSPDGALPWLAVAAGGAWFAGVALRVPAGDGDLLWQRWLGATILRTGALPRALGGETFSAPGAPWTPQEWLFSTALAATGARGLAWVVPLACALLATAALAFAVLRCARRGTSPVVATAAPLLCVLATVQSFGVRAQVAGWAGVSATLWLLERDDAWSWALVPLTALWANLHASAFLAPVFASAVAIATRTRRSAAIAAGSALATLATPFGVELPRYALGLVTSPIRHSISEWGPTSIASGAFVLGALPLVAILVLFGVRGLRDRLVVALALVALFGAVRNVPVFALAVAPIALGALPRRSVAPSPFAARTTVAAVGLAALALGALSWRAGAAPEARLPAEAARALLASAPAPHVFCEDFAWCSLFLGRGGARVFLDGRCDPYPEAVWRDYRTVLAGNPRWSAILAARGVDAVLARPGGALDTLLNAAPGWRALAADARARVYLRAGAQRQAGAG